MLNGLTHKLLYPGATYTFNILSMWNQWIIYKFHFIFPTSNYLWILLKIYRNLSTKYRKPLKKFELLFRWLFQDFANAVIFFSLITPNVPIILLFMLLLHTPFVHQWTDTKACTSYKSQDPQILSKFWFTTSLANNLCVK